MTWRRTFPEELHPDHGHGSRLPLRSGWSTGIQMDNVSPNLPAPDSQAVNPGYFATLGIPLIRGWLLTPTDRKGQPYVAVVKQQILLMGYLQALIGSLHDRPSWPMDGAVPMEITNQVSWWTQTKTFLLLWLRPRRCDSLRRTQPDAEPDRGCGQGPRRARSARRIHSCRSSVAATRSALTCRRRGETVLCVQSASVSSCG